MKKTLISASLIAGFLAGATALSVFADTTWTAPTAPPPGGNVAAPINVGSFSQAKTGLLGLASLLFLPTGQSTVAPGSVLVASTTGDGLVAWGTVAGTAVPSHLVTLVTPGNNTWTVPAGVTRIRIRAWGGGGGGFCGGGGNTGSPGGDGGYGEKIMTVSPGTSLSYVIGGGGAAGLRTNNDCGSGHPAPGPGGASYATYGGTQVVNAGGGGPALAGSGGPSYRGTASVGDILTYGAGGAGGANGNDGNPGQTGAIVIEY